MIHERFLLNPVPILASHISPIFPIQAKQTFPKRPRNARIREYALTAHKVQLAYMKVCSYK